MPMRRRIGGTAVFALLLFGGAMPAAKAQTLVKAAPNSEEAKATHGRTWVSFPSQLYTIRMDKDGKVTGTVAPISVAHEEPGEATCAGVRSVGALSNVAGSAMTVFTPMPRCNFNATDATLMLPLDSIGKLAKVCNQPAQAELTGGSGCRTELMTGKLVCVLPPVPTPGAAWRRRD